MVDIRVPGVGDTYKTSGEYLELNLGQGPSAAGVGTRECCLFGVSTVASGVTMNKRYRLASVDDAVSIGGYGSPIHRAARRYFMHPAVPALWCVPYAESSGGAPVAATLDVVFAGTATAAGEAIVYVGDTKCAVGYDIGDAHTTVSALMDSVINAQLHLGVTASDAAGTVSITTNVNGVSQNLATRIRVENTIGTGLTLTGGGDLTGGVDGSTTELTNLTAALAAQANVLNYYTGVLYGGAQSDSSAAFALLDSHISTKSTANPGLRSVGLFATRDTLTNATTTANARNDARCILLWNEDGDHDPAELVGEGLAILSSTENQHPALNATLKPLTLNPQYDEADRPTGDEISTALNEGITPIGSDGSGTRAFIDYWVSTRSKDATGTTDDWRAAPTVRRSVGDYLCTQIAQQFSLNFKGKILKADPVGRDGKVDTNAKRPSSLSYTPGDVRKMVQGILREAAANDIIDNVDDSIASMVCQLSKVAIGRVELSFNFDCVEHGQQLVGEANEVSPG